MCLISTAWLHQKNWVANFNTKAESNAKHCETATCGCPAGCGEWGVGGGGVEEWEQKARQQPNPRCVCHSACLHGDTLTCPILRVSSVQVPCSTDGSHPGRHLSLKLKYHLRENRSNIKKRWRRSLLKGKLTFPSSSSAFRSKDRCSWTVVEAGEPCRGGGEENVTAKEKKKHQF